VSEGRIIIPRWEEFQHYKNRDPKWIKNYVRLLDDDAYMSLSLHARGVLHGLWMAYARSGANLGDDVARLTRRLSSDRRDRVTTPTLLSLNHAGFIDLSASTLLAQRRGEERDTPKAVVKGQRNGPVDINPKTLRSTP